MLLAEITEQLPYRRHVPGSPEVVWLAEQIVDAAAIVAAAGDLPPEAEGLPQRWTAILTVEGLRTTDHRAIALEALIWRELPFCLFAQLNNAGHYDAPIVGVVETIERQNINGMNCVVGTGRFDLGSDNGREAARLVSEQILRWGSIDLEVLSSEYREIGGSDPWDDDDWLDMLFGPDDGDWYEEITSGRIMGFTLVATPAFPQAICVPDGMALDPPEPMGEAPMVQPGLMASVASVTVPERPPTAWFDDPQLSGPTPLTVTEDGRVFGHLAEWGVCHVGIQNVCVIAPHSQSDYADFHNGVYECDDGTLLRVGKLTVGTGHAPLRAGEAAAAHHYDNTGTVAAVVRAGEDDFGPWVAGAVKHGATPEQIRDLRMSPLSGDWRTVRGHYELIAALAVNTPGFGIRAAAGCVDGEQVSLIAAAVPKRVAPLRQLAQRVLAHERLLAGLRPVLLASLDSRVHAEGMNDDELLEAFTDLDRRVAALAR